MDERAHFAGDPEQEVGCPAFPLRAGISTGRCVSVVPSVVDGATATNTWMVGAKMALRDLCDYIGDRGYGAYVNSGPCLFLSRNHCSMQWNVDVMDACSSPIESRGRSSIAHALKSGVDSLRRDRRYRRQSRFHPATARR